MTRFAIFFSLALLLIYVPGGFTGPACSRKYFRTADCMLRCKSKWGWSGKVMSTDPWGPIMRNSNESLEKMLSKACGFQPQAPPKLVGNAQGGLSTTSIIPSMSFVTNTLKESTSPLVSIIKATSSIITPSIPTFVPSSTTASASSMGPIITRITSLQRESSRVISILPSTTRPLIQSTPDFRPETKTPKIVSAPVQAPTPSSTGVSNFSAGTSSNDIQAYLVGHNSVRARHGAINLTWNDNLAAKAQQWANGCDFKHSGGSLGAFGENLAAGTGSSYDISVAIKSWTDEVGQYNPKNPQASHFTQVVWKATTQVGCAIQLCNGIFDPSFGKAKYFVCEYSPAGNVNGQFVENVQV